MGLIALLSMLVACDTLPFKKEQIVPGHLVMERMKLPAQFKNADGSSYKANLDAIVIRPDDDQTHPMVTITHEYDPIDANSIFPEKLEDPAMEFARRGWVVVAFTRRGYGMSDGPFVEGYKACNGAAIVQTGRVSAADISEVIRLMAQKPYVDASKVISVGFSRGGYASIVLSAEPPPGLVAAISFSGGLSSDRACLNNGLVEAVATFGKDARIPTLWIYTENDRLISPEWGKQWYTAYTRAGGNAEFIVTPSFENNGHGLFRYGVRIWTPYVDAFLQNHGLKQMDGLMSKVNVRVINDDDW